MSFKTNTIPNEVIELLKKVSPSVQKITNTYLAGGTALSLFLGHRISVDLDFFTPHDFRAAQLTESLSQLGTFVPIDIKDNSIICQIDNVQLSLFKYGYPLLDSLDFYCKVPIASIRDIAAMKIIAIGDRGSRKDFYDLYTILKFSPLKIEGILDDVCTKFSITKDSLYHYIRAIGFFEDSRKEPDIQSLVTIDANWPDIESFFLSLVKRLIPTTS